MKDKQGIFRGKCTIAECECTDYVKPMDPNGVRCDYCDHAPAKHIKTIKLGACTKCEDCSSYEPENTVSFADCEYCDCPAEYHENADKLLSKRPNQPAAAETPKFSDSVGETQAAIAAALKCKLPNCGKTCFIESSGLAYDFCSKEHAIAYADMQKKQNVKTCTKCGKKPLNSGEELCQDCTSHPSKLE